MHGIASVIVPSGGAGVFEFCPNGLSLLLVKSNVLLALGVQLAVIRCVDGTIIYVDFDKYTIVFHPG